MRQKIPSADVSRETSGSSRQQKTARRGGSVKGENIRHRGRASGWRADLRAVSPDQGSVRAFAGYRSALTTVTSRLVRPLPGKGQQGTVPSEPVRVCPVCRAGCCRRRWPSSGKNARQQVPDPPVPRDKCPGSRDPQSPPYRPRRRNRRWEQPGKVNSTSAASRTRGASPAAAPIRAEAEGGPRLLGVRNVIGAQNASESGGYRGCPESSWRSKRPRADSFPAASPWLPGSHRRPPPWR